MIKRLAIAGAALLLLGAAGIAAFIASFDINAWRPRIIAEAERASGRSVTIGGLAMQGWLSPSITLRDVSLGNLPGGSRGAMVLAPRAQMQVSLRALLAGRIAMRRLVLDSPDVLLELVNGRPNWEVGAGSTTGPVPVVAIGELLVRDARLHLPGTPHGGVELVRLAVNGSGDMRSEGELRWADTMLRFEARGGPLARIMGGADGPMPISARFQMQGAQLTLNGTLRNPRGLQGYALEATGEADAAALHRIAQLTGGSGPIPASIAFRARIAGSGFDWPAEQAIRFEMAELALVPGIVLSHMLLESDAARAPLRVSLAGTRLADRFTLDGTLGPWRQGAAVPLDLTGTLLGHQLRVAGTVVDPQAGRGIAVQAALDSPVLGRVHAQINERGGFFADGIELTAIRAEGAAGPEGRLSISRQGVSGKLVLGAVDLDALPQPPPSPVAAPVAAPLAAAAPALPAATPPARRSERVIPDAAIDLSAVWAWPMELELAVGTLRHQGVEYRELAARAVVADRRAVLDLLEVTLPTGRVTLRAAAQQAERGTQLQLALRGDGLNLAQLLPESPLSGAADLELELRGQGDTWRAWAASLVGHAGVAVLNGQLDSRALQATIPAGLGGLAPRIDLVCLAMRFDVVAGIAQARMLYADTSLGRLMGGGRINLRDETLELRLNTDLRLPPLSALGVRVRAPVPISGTLAAPTLETGAMLGGGAAGTVAGLVPGLNQALGLQGMPDCGPPLAVARGGRSGPVPRSLMPADPAPVQNLLRGLGVR